MKKWVLIELSPQGYPALHNFARAVFDPPLPSFTEMNDPLLLSVQRSTPQLSECDSWHFTGPEPRTWLRTTPTKLFIPVGHKNCITFTLSQLNLYNVSGTHMGPNYDPLSGDCENVPGFKFQYERTRLWRWHFLMEPIRQLN